GETSRYGPCPSCDPGRAARAQCWPRGASPRRLLVRRAGAAPGPSLPRQAAQEPRSPSSAWWGGHAEGTRREKGSAPGAGLDAVGHASASASARERGAPGSVRQPPPGAAGYTERDGGNGSRRRLRWRRLDQWLWWRQLGPHRRKERRGPRALLHFPPRSLALLDPGRRPPPVLARGGADFPCSEGPQRGPAAVRASGQLAERHGDGPGRALRVLGVPEPDPQGRQGDGRGRRVFRGSDGWTRRLHRGGRSAHLRSPSELFTAEYRFQGRWGARGGRSDGRGLPRKLNDFGSR